MPKSLKRRSIARAMFRGGIVLALSGLATPTMSHAAVDTVVTVVDRVTGLGTGTNALASFGYNPLTDTMYVSGFGAGGALRIVTNVNGAQVSTVAVSEGQLQLFYRDGDPNRGVSTPLQSGILLNPVAVGARPAYSFAVITDAGFTRFPATSTTDPAATKRLYTYNLQGLNQSAGPNPTSPFNDGRDVFTPLVTFAAMQTVTGSTATSSNTGRQAAFSGDGQSVYFLDTSTAYGGMWKIPAAGGAPTRILNFPDIANTEPAVTTAGGVDSIYFGGGAGNVGGIDKITHVLSSGATSAPLAHVTGAALAAFLETNVTDISIASMTSDAAGNLYFNNTDSSPERRGIYKLDTQGRLAKVVSYAERFNAYGSITPVVNPNSNTLRMQPRTTTYTGPNGTFPITQILYTENSPVSLVAGANVFLTGDFNRDNALTSADITSLKSNITVRGIIQPAAELLKFDVNGNSTIDWKDVDVLRGFYDLGLGDVDLNGLVDFADFQVIQNNFSLTGKNVIEGDLNGDNSVTFADFQILQNSFAFQSSIIGVGMGFASFDAGQWNSFITANAVPEPGTWAALTLFGVVGYGVRRRRRTQST